MDAWREKTFVPYEQRKKILLMSDDLRLPSGVGTMSKYIVANTLHTYNWVQIGGAVKHPEQGKVVDMSHEFNKILKIDKSYMKIYPTSGYGNPDLVRYMINVEKPDAILHFTDPRQWIWLYQMEHEIRQICPILFYHIWDDLPFPGYNESYYESCDWIASISKQTYNIVNQVLRDKSQTKLEYIPHGIDSKVYRKLTISNPGQQLELKDASGNKIFKSEFEEMLELKSKMFGRNEFDFVIMYNNRNIRRKMVGDVILGYKTFCDMIGKEKAKKVALIMHTNIVDENGTDIEAVVRAISPTYNIIFSENKLDARFLNYMYNLSSVFINIASNEGFGLTTAEALMAETPIIANVTGGLQDQMGFVDEKGKYLSHTEHFNAEWGSNHDGRYKKHGEWVFPIWPNNRSLVGSVPTPYIFDDRVSWEDVAKTLLKVYNLPKEDLERRGKLGREYLCDSNVGMEAVQMGLKFIDGINDVLTNWKPARKVTVINSTKYDRKPHPTGITLTSEV